jgi:HEAT repeat protein
VRDENVHRDLRIAAAKSLGALAHPPMAHGAKTGQGKSSADASAPLPPAAEALRSMLGARFADARVRAAVVEQAAHASEGSSPERRDSLAEQLTHAFRTDPSYAVRAACIEGLGTLRALSQRIAIAQALETDSQHDQIRKAAVRALADLDTPESLDLVIKCTAPGKSSAVRSTAVEALPDLSHHDADRVFGTLVSLLDDREPRTKEAAGKALSQIGGERVRKCFETRLSAMPSQYWAGMMKIWLRDMRKDGAAQARATRGG